MAEAEGGVDTHGVRVGREVLEERRQTGRRAWPRAGHHQMAAEVGIGNCGTRLGRLAQESEGCTRVSALCEGREAGLLGPSVRAELRAPPAVRHEGDLVSCVCVCVCVRACVCWEDFWVRQRL